MKYLFFFSAEMCKLSHMAGFCGDKEVVFGYIPETGECEQFAYTGCGGNINRFATMEECTATCGSIPQGIPPMVLQKYPGNKIISK